MKVKKKKVLKLKLKFMLKLMYHQHRISETGIPLEIILNVWQYHFPLKSLFWL